MVKQYIKILLKLFINNRVCEKIVSSFFHILYYHSDDTWRENVYLGYPIQQNPLDIYLYQELIFKLKPNFILQTGVYQGGSILYFATLLDTMELGSEVKVIGIDLKLSEMAKGINHSRLHLFEGDSADSQTVKLVEKILPYPSKGLLILDSNHSSDHVFKELELYKNFLDVGSYIVVEDTNLNGHPINPFFGAGPYEAVEKFLSTDKKYIRDDKLWRRNKFSFHQYGWLKKVS